MQGNTPYMCNDASYSTVFSSEAFQIHSKQAMIKLHYCLCAHQQVGDDVALPVEGLICLWLNRINYVITMNICIHIASPNWRNFCFENDNWTNCYIPWVLVNWRCMILFQTIHKVLISYAEMVMEDFEKYTTKHQVVSWCVRSYNTLCCCHMNRYNWNICFLQSFWSNELIGDNKITISTIKSF